MKGVLPLLEIELAARLDESGVAGVPVLPGQGDGTRPDQYVSVVAVEGEHRGFAHLITVQFRIVGPVFSTASSVLQERLGAVYSWIMDSSSPMACYNANGLQIFGHSPADLSSEVRDAQRAEILEFKVGAMASVDTPQS